MYYFSNHSSCGSQPPQMSRTTFSSYSAFTSRWSRLAIFRKVRTSGWEEFVHHFETVVGSTPNCRASHEFVRLLSFRISFSLFTFCIGLSNLGAKIMKNFHYSWKTADPIANTTDILPFILHIPNYSCINNQKSPLPWYRIEIKTLPLHWQNPPASRKTLWTQRGIL